MDEASPYGGTLKAQQRRQQTGLERLPALNYSMLKEQALRKKLAEIGISNQGPRLILERRHKEWVTIWNANCDSARPKKRSQLLQDLDAWERTQGSRISAIAKANSSGGTIKDKSFDGVAWSTKHDSSFKDLIANARRSKLEVKAPSKDVHKEREEKKPVNHLRTAAQDSMENHETDESRTTNMGSSLTNNREIFAVETPLAASMKEEAGVQSSLAISGKGVR